MNKEWHSDPELTGFLNSRIHRAGRAIFATVEDLVPRKHAEERRKEEAERARARTLEMTPKVSYPTQATPEALTVAELDYLKDLLEWAPEDQIRPGNQPLYRKIRDLIAFQKRVEQAAHRGRRLRA